jgi:hypothetical protein
MNIHDIDMEQAACKTADPELFFDGKEDSVDAAKSYCETCPVVLQCLTYALTNEEYGIWGGTTMNERLRVRGNSRATKELIVKVTSK